MRTEEVIKKQIEAEKLEIINNVMSGCFNSYNLIEHKSWIQALKWVLGEEE